LLVYYSLDLLLSKLSKAQSNGKFCERNTGCLLVINEKSQHSQNKVSEKRSKNKKKKRKRKRKKSEEEIKEKMKKIRGNKTWKGGRRGEKIKE
jgi:hypothetical protein